MKAMAIRDHSLRPVMEAIPAPAADQLRIKVYAAGLNRADIFQKQGSYSPPKNAPQHIPGLEVAGIVDATGRNITKFKIGDRVCALLEGGGYAEYAVVRHTQALLIPDSVDFIAASGVPEAFATIWSNLYDHGKIKRNKIVLIHSASSGIGTTAIQIIKAAGATCYATTSSEKKQQALYALGADQVINYREEDFLRKIKEITAEVGVDIILDPMGGETIEKNLNILKPGGRLILIAFLQGARATVNFAPLLMKGLTLQGTTLRRKTPSEKARIIKNIERTFWPWLKEGKITPVIDRVFPLEQAAEAQNYMELNQHVGKIILQVVQ